MRLMRMFVIAVLLTTHALHAQAFSGGAPVQACMNQQVQSPHSLSSAGTGGFSLAAARSFYIPGKTTVITLRGSSAFEGVLLSAFDQSSNLAGTWQAPGGAYQLACNSQSITHASANLKTIPASFTWTAPAAGAGAVAFNATVVLSTSTSFVISGAMLSEIDDDLFLDGFE
jgi:hypothetical protein